MAVRAPMDVLVTDITRIFVRLVGTPLVKSFVGNGTDPIMPRNRLPTTVRPVDEYL